MLSFLSALQFLTIIPVKIKHIDNKKIANALTYFPVIGLLLGLILAWINRLLFILGFEPFISSIILVIALVVLTGGLHLDGLADTSDALLSRKNKEDMLNIMRDSHVGAMGILAIISVILLKIAFLSSIDSKAKITALLLVCLLSRWSLVLAMFLFPYAREEGKAKAFTEGINLKIFAYSTMIALACSVAIWQVKGLFVIAITAIAAYVTTRFINNKIDGITGDVLGAVNELTEIFVLFSICILERTNL